jgi:hypothetical protein
MFHTADHQNWNSEMEKFGKTLLLRLNQVEGAGKFEKPDLSAQEPMGIF